MQLPARLLELCAAGALLTAAGCSRATPAARPAVTPAPAGQGKARPGNGNDQPVPAPKPVADPCPPCGMG